MYGTKQLIFFLKKLINFLQYGAIKPKELNWIKNINKNVDVENCGEVNQKSKTSILYIYIYIYIKREYYARAMHGLIKELYIKFKIYIYLII